MIELVIILFLFGVLVIVYNFRHYLRLSNLIKKGNKVVLFPGTPQEITKYFNAAGQLHRIGGPAVLDAAGNRRYYEGGKLHRKGEPAVIQSNGARIWYYWDQKSRNDGPAVENPDGSEEWWLLGKRHRYDGPAVVKADGTTEWWFAGELISEDSGKQYAEAYSRRTL